MQHWSVKTSREQWREAAFVAALDAIPEGWETLQRANVAVLWRYHVRRTRDLDNLVAGLKPILDGLVLARVLEDDHSGVLESLGPLRVEIGATEDETVLIVTEVLDD